MQCNGNIHHYGLIFFKHTFHRSLYDIKTRCDMHTVYDDSIDRDEIWMLLSREIDRKDGMSLCFRRCYCQ